MSVPTELKDIRIRFRRTLADCARVLGCSIESYRNRETGKIPPSGGELALLAEFYKMPLHAAFPSYEPTPQEYALIRQADPYRQATTKVA